MIHLAAAVALAALITSSAFASDTKRQESAPPTVMIAMLVRNKEPYLPYTLTRLSQLDYPRERLSLWLRSDHNQDRSADIVRAWLDKYGALYSHVDAALDTTSPPLRPDEAGAADLSPSRRQAVVEMKEAALTAARSRGADFVWFLDADVVLHDGGILRQLLAMGQPLVAPMLRSDGGKYSNFWSAVDENFHDEEGDLYETIYRRKKRGCFAVPLIRSCVLVDLRESRADALTFVREKLASPTGPAAEDAITFALSAQQAGLKMHVCNQKDFGQLPVPLESSESLNKEWDNILNIKLEALQDLPPLPVASTLRSFVPPPPEKSWLGFDRIYSIGLARRQERWNSLLASFDELGIATDQVQAVDGRTLTEASLADHNISMPSDPDTGFYIELNKGEIGCFLSHYGVWINMLQNGYERVIILENDVRPTLEFKRRLAQLRDEADRLRPRWDFLYLHRTQPDTDGDRPVEGAELLIRPGFCYSCVAYALTRRGAEKLVAGRPLQNMMCVDDYVPLMAGNAPHSRWLTRFPGAGSLRAFASSENLIEQPDVNHAGYISDTTELDGTVGARSCEHQDSDDGDCLRPAE